jgi:hypothetical protein
VGNTVTPRQVRMHAPPREASPIEIYAQCPPVGRINSGGGANTLALENVTNGYTWTATALSRRRAHTANSACSSFPNCWPSSSSTGTSIRNRRRRGTKPAVAC